MKNATYQNPQLLDNNEQNEKQKEATVQNTAIANEKTQLLDDVNQGENYYTITHTDPDGEQKEVKEHEAGIIADDEVIDLDSYQSMDMDSPKSEFDWFKEVFKEMSGIALPMAGSYTFCFKVFLAVLLLQLTSESEEDTAAATLVSTYMNTICILAFAPILAGAMNLSKKLGEWRELDDQPNEKKEIEEISIQGENAPVTKKEEKKENIESLHINLQMIAATVSIPATLALLFSKPILISALGQDELVSISAAKFLRIYSAAPLALMPRGAIDQVLFSMGEAKAAMWMGFGTLSIGATLSVLLGFGIKMGSLQFPKMHQEGIALGFVIEDYLALVSHGLYLKFKKECKEFDFYKVAMDRIRRNLQGLKELLRTGSSITFTTALDLGSSFTVGIFSGLLGKDEQAAMSYCMQIIFFEFIPAAAFSFGCSQEVSRWIGAENFVKAQKIASYGLTTSLIYLTPLPIFFAAYPKALEVISGGATEPVRQILKKLVPIMATGTIIETARFNLLQQLRAFEDLNFPNVVAFFGMAGGIGLSAALGFATPMGIYGIATGYTTGIGVTAVGLFLRWRKKVAELSERKSATKVPMSSIEHDTTNSEIISEQDGNSDVTRAENIDEGNPSTLESLLRNGRLLFFCCPKDVITQAGSDETKQAKKTFI